MSILPKHAPDPLRPCRKHMQTNMATSKSAKNAATSATKSLQTGLGDIKDKKALQKVILGGSWAPLGEGLGRSGTFFGASWPCLGC